MSTLVWGHRRHARWHGRWHAHWLLRPSPLMPLAFVGVGIGLIVAFTLVVSAVLAVAALVVSAAIVVGVLGGLGFAAFQLVRIMAPGLAGESRWHGRRMQARAERRLDAGGKGRTRPQVTVETPVDALRRRYAAGEIGQTEFRQRLTDLLKERYVRGDLTLAEFESRVRQLYLDPALRPPA